MTPSETVNRSDTTQAALKIAEALTKWLAEKFDDEQFWKDLQPLVNVLVNVGLVRGTEYVEKLLEQIVSDKPYAAWRAVIEYATVNDRIVLMEASRQQGIADRVREINAQKDLAAVFKVVLQVVVTVVGALL